MRDSLREGEVIYVAIASGKSKPQPGTDQPTVAEQQQRQDVPCRLCGVDQVGQCMPIPESAEAIAEQAHGLVDVSLVDPAGTPGLGIRPT
jgi:hypothetical protein